ncbi:hypothetical protein CC86DRAFT_370706 [Ophiobolus disseminans]|uniref:LIM zinc-binding domain-containing protein n=1 Tax=Ophiobolus disseminans TaxID=1469910 RepID=A0A6A6ZY83_9PLEO|nr:hypothetical protein CC86DRAFT_370706 [Ophiobolus disseminans]
MERKSASGLPMIKCSSCGIDIDIMQLADHVCAPTAPSTTATLSPTSPLSPKLDRAATFGGVSSSNRAVNQGPLSRMRPPPRIDSSAANKPFKPQELSPMSNRSDPMSPSLLSPPPRSPYKMNRSETAPTPRRRLAPPSPTLPGNLDCAFPPFPSKRSATTPSTRPPTRERSEPRPQHLYAEPSPLFAPLSPRIDGGDNVTKRMDSIAPGPFDGRADRTPSNSSTPRSMTHDGPSLGHRRAGTQGSSRSVGSISKQRTSMSSTTSRASAYSTRSVGLPARPKLGLGGSAMPPPPLPATSQSNEGIDAFLDRLQKESMKPTETQVDDRPRAVPMRQGSQEEQAPPSRPRRPSGRDVPPTGLASLQPSAFDALPNNVFPRRKQSLGGIKLASQWDADQPRTLQPAPLLPPTFHHDPPMNPLHTPSDSGLSDDSYASSGFRSTASSRSSPAGSEVGHSREVSKLSQSEDRGATIARTTSPDSYVNIRASPFEEKKEAEPAVQVGSKTLFTPSKPLSPDYANVPESPMDPAIQVGMSFAPRPRQPGPQQPPNTNAGLSPLGSSPDVAPRRQDTRPPSKGKCRGCSEPIVGKSVKDSSGRLTGRYHKQCFTCRTCNDSFPTAEFYVFNNSPYCERHYHELNGSICASCNRGIEGQYLETDSRRKFHPRCFTCTTCRVVLRDDYYEVGGQKYCDRHARSAANPPQNYLGPGNYRPRMEKRSTRLMMMA